MTKDSRKAAVEAATELSKAEGLARVKIVESRFDPVEGVFEEFDVQFLSRDGGKVPAASRAGGNGANGPLTPKDDGMTGSESAAPCHTPEDLATPWARRTMARVLQKTLEAWAVTPLELQHHLGHYKRLVETGTTLQAAVQQAAISMPRPRGSNAATFVRTIYGVIDQAAKALEEEAEAEKPTSFSSVDQLWLNAPGGRAERQRRVMITIAADLAPRKGWVAKAERLVALIPSQGSGEGLTVVDRLLSEFPLFRGGLGAFVALKSGNPLRAVELAADTIRKPQIELIIELFDLLEGTAGDAEGPGIGLLSAIREGKLPETSTELLHRLATEIDQNRRLTGSSADPDGVVREAKAIAEVAQRLAALETAFAPRSRRANESVEGLDRAISRIRVALESRSEDLLRPEVLGVQLGTLSDPIAQINLILEVGRYVFGTLNRRRVARQLLARLSGEAALMRLGDVPNQEAIGRLKLAVSWQAEVASCEYSHDDRLQLLEAIDHLGCKLMDKLRLFKTVAQRKPEPVDQAVALFDLFNSKLVTRGQGTAAVRKQLLSCIQAAGGAETFVAKLQSRGTSSRRQTAMLRFLAGDDDLSAHDG